MPTQLPPPPGAGPAWTPGPADPPRMWVIVKALSLAVFAGVIAAVLATFVLVVLWGALFVGARLGWTDEATMTTILENGRWVTVGVAIALAIWAGGYGATARGSGPRIASGLAIGLPFGFGLAVLGSDFWTVAAVGIGWAVAIPARSVRIAAIRAAPAALLGLLAIPFSVDGLAAQVAAGLGGVVVGGAVVVVMIGAVEPALRRDPQRHRLGDRGAMAEPGRPDEADQ